MAKDDKNERTETEAEGGGKVNDPLTRGDVEAPRAEFEGRTPK